MHSPGASVSSTPGSMSPYPSPGMPPKSSPHAMSGTTPPGFPPFSGANVGGNVPYGSGGGPGTRGSDTDGGLPKDLAQVSDQELTALLSRQDIATSLAEDLLAQFSQQQSGSQENKDSISSTPGGDSSSHKSTSNQNLDGLGGGLSSDPFGSSDKAYSPASSALPGQMLNEGSTSPRSITHSAPPNEVCGTMTTDMKGEVVMPQKPKQQKGDWDDLELKPDPMFGVPKSTTPTSHVSPSSVSINMKSSELIASLRRQGKYPESPAPPTSPNTSTRRSPTLTHFLTRCGMPLASTARLGVPRLNREDISPLSGKKE